MERYKQGALWLPVLLYQLYVILNCLLDFLRLNADVSLRANKHMIAEEKQNTPDDQSGVFFVYGGLLYQLRKS